jgi:uncharacterized membrane protein
MEQPFPAFRTVSASQGWQWFNEGFRLFAGQPWLWIGISIASVIVLAIVGSISLIAWASPVLIMVLLGGLLVGCAHQAAGETLEIDHVLAGCQRPLNALLILGAVLLVTDLAEHVIGHLLAIVLGLGAVEAALAAAANGDPSAILTAMLAAGAATVLWLAVMLVIASLVALAFLFAPALVAVGGVAPQDALRASFRAAWANWRAFAVYSLIFIGFAVIATITVIGIVVLLPISVTTAYAAYRDIFPDLPLHLSEDE